MAVGKPQLRNCFDDAVKDRSDGQLRRALSCRVKNIFIGGYARYGYA